jgi:hypothetical protein
MLLLESKQSLINIGYPEVIAKLFYKRYANLAFLLGKWYKDYNDGYTRRKDWFLQAHYVPSKGSLSIWDKIRVYESTVNADLYRKVASDMEIQVDPSDPLDDYTLKELRQSFEDDIEDSFFGGLFFKAYPLIIDIISGKIKNLAGYAEKKFQDAELEYAEKQLFTTRPIIKQYKDGYRWFNAGPKCRYVGVYMKNYGSSSLMGSDKDRTILALIDGNKKPHVLLVYSPNEKRLSNEEGVASTAVKAVYTPYILDLMEILNASMDTSKVKAKHLKLSILFKGHIRKLKPLFPDKKETSYNEYYIIDIDGEKYYTDSYMIVSVKDAKLAYDAIKANKINVSSVRNKLIDIFNHYNRRELEAFGVKYYTVEQLKMKISTAV